MRPLRLVSLKAIPLALSVLLVPSAAVFGKPPDALDRPEFDRELSVGVEQGDVVSVFRVLAKVTQVPFVLALENDPGLELTLNAENMTVRAILTSLAGGYGLEYATSPEGVVVRRTGAAATRAPITVGAWPPEAGPLYELTLQVRTEDGQPLSMPKLTTRLNQVAVLKQGLGGGTVLLLDQEKAIAEPGYVAGIELRLIPKRQTDQGLELLMELVTARVTGEARYVRDHRVVEKTAGKGATLLFRTDDGHEVVLLDWRQRQPKEPAQ